MSEIGGIVTLFVGISALMTLWRSARTAPRDNKGWIVVSSFILLVTIVASWQLPAAAGWIAAGTWLVLAALPALGLRRLDRFLAAGDFTGARQLARLLALLHPFDGWRGLPDVVDALALAESGSYDEALARLAASESARMDVGRTAVAYIYHRRNDWAGLRAWIEGNLDPAAIGRDPSMILTYLQTMGETGALNDLLATLARYERTLRHIRGTMLGMAYLYAFAYGGRPDAVEHLLDGPLSLMGDSDKEAWRATALQAAGEHEAAKARLEGARAAAGGETRALIDRLLARPVVEAATVLDETGRARLEALVKAVQA